MLYERCHLFDDICGEYQKSKCTQNQEWNIPFTLFCILILFSCNQNSDTTVKNEIWTPDMRIEMANYPLKIDNEIFTGIIKDTFDNGQLKYKKRFSAGKENGEQTGWHCNGKISYQYIARDGNKEGLYLEYYPSGQMQIKQSYAKGKVMENKVLDPEGKVLVNSKSKNGRVYGLLGSSSCRSVYNENEFNTKNEE